MKAIASLLVTLALVAGGCTNETQQPPSDLRIVATTTIAGDLARSVVGEHGTVEVIMPLGADPHDFSPSSRQVALLQEADLIVAFGLGLEEGLESSLRAVEAAGVPLLWIAEVVDPMLFEDDSVDGHEDDGEDIDHDDEGDEGHSHEGFDPHVWMDPLRMADAVHVLALRLSGIAPDVDWVNNAKFAAAELLDADRQMRELLDRIPDDRRLLVTNHFSLGYFAERYGLIVLGTIIPGGGTLGAPSSADLAALVSLITNTGAPAIFREPGDTTGLAEAIAAEVGHPVQVVSLTTDSLGEPGSDTDTLVKLLLTTARTIAEALS